MLVELHYAIIRSTIVSKNAAIDFNLIAGTHTRQIR